ncbi:hypothetical protein BpHYR1_025595 [Brachionus plicatilis]|uniref:Uncharacterized protein n=1 Tax=Brachionus plicatilis TaxID=10195 RepID=A0A3M7S555_BRAPC|nr:hypothetical protein BpHYR1_025595 [Brachionus plicatilis]
MYSNQLCKYIAEFLQTYIFRLSKIFLIDKIELRRTSQPVKILANFDNLYNYKIKKKYIF